MLDPFPYARSLDCETYVRHGTKAPELVCVSLYDPRAGEPQLYHRLQWREWLPILREWLRDRDARIVNQNLPFDWGVILEHSRRLLHAGKISRAVLEDLADGIWTAYAEGRAASTEVLAMLISIARGEPMAVGTRKQRGLHGWSLDALSKVYLGHGVAGKEGPDVWRLRYAELSHTPLEAWPQEALDYAREDPRQALRLWEAERKICGGHLAHSEDRNHRAAWWLWLQGAWGIRTDPRQVEALAAYVQHTVDQAEPLARAAGWLRDDGSRDLRAQGELIRRCLEERGVWDPSRHLAANAKWKDGSRKVKSDRKTLLATGEPSLVAWAESDVARKEQTTFIPVLRQGTKTPIRAWWTVLKESERIACERPNLTQVSGDGHRFPDAHPDPVVEAFLQGEAAAGRERQIAVRRCYVPRDGWLLFGADFSTAELRAFAQHALDTFGASRMADALWAEHRAKEAGQPAADLHVHFAATILGIAPTEAARRYAAGDKEVSGLRKRICKAWNFGRLGGLYVNNFARMLWEQGVRLADTMPDQIQEARRLDALWMQTWPEANAYLNRLKGQTRNGPISLRIRTGLTRGGVEYTDGANHGFQNQVAVWLKDAGFRVARECFTVPESPLYGCRMVVTPHDEIIAEAPEDQASAAALRLAEIMKGAARDNAPDVPHAADPFVSRVWDKAAESTVQEDGSLSVWS